MNITDIPKEWRDILADIQQVSPGAIIAGGALRDLASGHDPKDIDIFVPEADLYTVGVPRFVDTSRLEETCLRWRKRRRRLFRMDYLNITHDVGAVMEFVDWPWALTPRVPLNVIVAKAPYLGTDWLGRFDFTVNQVMFDGNGIYQTTAAQRDRAAKVFRYVREGGEEDAARSWRRAERFKMKYPDWTFIVPGPLAA